MKRMLNLLLNFLILFFFTQAFLHTAWAAGGEKRASAAANKHAHAPRATHRRSGGKANRTTGEFTTLTAELTVNWQLTRSHVLSSTSSTNETYREIWSYQLTGTGQAFLQSPRARVPVYSSIETGERVIIPAAVFIDERDLAELLGLEMTLPVTDVEELPEAKLVMLQLRAGTAKPSVNATLRPSDDEQDAVHMEFAPRVQ